MDLRLKDLRKARNLTQQDMAEILRVKVRTYAAWERQENDLSLNNAVKIADALDISLDKLCNRTKYLDITKQIREENLKSLISNFEKLTQENKYQIISLTKSLVSANN